MRDFLLVRPNQPLPAATEGRDHIAYLQDVAAVPRVCAPIANLSATLPAQADLSNVVPFARRVAARETDAPQLELTPADRPAPPPPPIREWLEWVLALAGIVVVHAGLYAAFNRAPPPQASIGVEVMTVEIVLGANETAGLEKTKGQSAVNSRASSGEKQPQQRDQTLPVEKDAGPGETVIKEAKADATGSIATPSKEAIPDTRSLEVAAATPVEAKPNETKLAEAKPIEAKPIEQTVVREAVPVATPAKPVASPTPESQPTPPQPTEKTTAAEAPRAVEVQNEPEPATAVEAIEVAKAADKREAQKATAPAARPTEAESKPVELAAVMPKTVEPLPETPRKTEVTPKPKPRPKAAPDAKPVRAAAPASKRRETAAKATRSRTKDKSSASKASVAASGVGRGRSAATTNYRGIVGAHLARYKRHTHGNNGTATVAFHLNGSGRVTSVKLARSSGVAGIDQEAVSMVRRASPFPPPPDGRAMSFTVPLRFVVQ